MLRHDVDKLMSLQECCFVIRHDVDKFMSLQAGDEVEYYVEPPRGERKANAMDVVKLPKGTLDMVQHSTDIDGCCQTCALDML